MKVDLPHPRNDQDPQFREIVDEIYTLMTTPIGVHIPEKAAKFKTIDISYRLPHVGVSVLTGFIEALAAPEYMNKKVELPKLAEALHFEIDDLFPITEALEILRFASVSEGEIELTQSGKIFAEADILARKKIFAEHLMQYVPIVKHIREILDLEMDHEALETVFIKALEKTLSKEAAETVLTVVIDWGRYAEIFAYDYNTGMLSLENP